MAGERVRLILNRLADITRNRSSEYDSEGQSEMGGQKDAIAQATFIAELFGIAA